MNVHQHVFRWGRSQNNSLKIIAKSTFCVYQKIQQYNCNEKHPFETRNWKEHN